MKIALFLFMIFMPAFARAEGVVESLRGYEYWDNGTVRTCTIYDTNGYPKGKIFSRNDGTVEKTEKYDTAGNRIEEAFYDQNGNLKPGIDGWSMRRWWYEGTRVVSQISYDEEGVPLERKRFSEGGRLVYRQFRDDGNLDPYEEASMAIMLGGANMEYYDPVERAVEDLRGE